MKYIKDILEIIKTYNLFFLAIIVFLFQIISFFLKPYSINIYNPATFMTIYVFINTPYSIYQLIMGGIISTFISYFIYKLLFNLDPKMNNTLINIMTFIIVLVSSVIFKCVSVPAIAYTLAAPISIPINTFSYLSSYILSTIIIFIVCSITLYFFKNTIQNLFKYDLFNLKQLEKNLINYSI